MVWKKKISRNVRCFANYIFDTEDRNVKQHSKGLQSQAFPDFGLWYLEYKLQSLLIRWNIGHVALYHISGPRQLVQMHIVEGTTVFLIPGWEFSYAEGWLVVLWRFFHCAGTSPITPSLFKGQIYWMYLRVIFFFPLKLLINVYISMYLYVYTYTHV